jgi:hypothetical protein
MPGVVLRFDDLSNFWILAILTALGGRGLESERKLRTDDRAATPRLTPVKILLLRGVVCFYLNLRVSHGLFFPKLPAKLW